MKQISNKEYEKYQAPPFSGISRMMPSYSYRFGSIDISSRYLPWAKAAASSIHDSSSSSISSTVPIKT